MKRFVTALVLAACVPALSHAAEGAFAFTRSPLCPRTAGMGQAGEFSGEWQGGVLRNPATQTSDGWHIAFGGRTWQSDIEKTWGTPIASSFGFQLDNGVALGLSLAGWCNNNIERRDDTGRLLAVGNSVELANANEYVAVAGVSWEAWPKWNIGASVAAGRRELGLASPDQAYSFGIGLLYDRRNVFPKLGARATAFAVGLGLPFTGVEGASRADSGTDMVAPEAGIGMQIDYHGERQESEPLLIASWDIVHTWHYGRRDACYNIGAELRVPRIPEPLAFYVRTGVRHLFLNTRWSAGMGAGVRKWNVDMRFDYALLMPQNHYSGFTHLMGIAVCSN